MERVAQVVDSMMVAVILMFLSLPSCSSVTPHENFKDHMSHTVGKRINDPRTWARPDRYIGSKVLQNGNTENEYQFHGSCHYFFEYDPETRIIVGWRFEGSERDCEIMP